MLQPLREGPDFTLYRGWMHGNTAPVLAIALTAQHPSPLSLRRLQHEYSLAVKLDPAWAAKPLTLARHKGRTILLLKDPGGQPLDRVLERDQGRPLDLTRVLHIAVGLATGVGLPPQQADQIFNAFFTTKPHGTGMGLRISQSIVESHGGRLWAAANSPRGANFYFTLSANARVPQ
jgi:hypothetical protein